MRSLCLFLTIIMLIFGFVATAQTQEHYSRAKINLDVPGHSLMDLAALGLAVDHGEYKKGTYFISDFSEREIKLAKDAGFKVDIVIADVVKHYQEQNKKKIEKITSVSCLNPDVSVPTHFHLGSYGGYFTYSELLAILDSMQLLYPGIISTKQAIDTFHTIEGRPIYWLRMSNNPSVNQPTKPQMLVSAIHHAREPDCLSTTIFYMWYMLEHYSTDPQIKAIIDNTELYFIPCLNPDGYIYNETSFPGGGGMHRKNRRLNSDGSYGVDLNRNYSYKWAYDNFGSSPTMASETYRGTSAFSEPETQAMKWFAEHHRFKMNLNYHSYNNDYIYPWGFVPALYTPDSSVFVSDGAFIAGANRFRYGTCYQMLDYITNGDSDDWMYGDTSAKSKIFAYTPEVGSLEDGFYPPASSIIPDCKNNLIANINTATLLLPYAEVKSTDQKILFQPAGYLHYDIQRLGFPDTCSFNVQIVPLDGWLTVPSTPITYSGMSLLQKKSDSVSYTLAATTPNGQLVSYVIKVNNGYFNHFDTVRFYYGKYHTVTKPSTDTLSRWASFGWSSCTSEYYSAPACIKSSDDGLSSPCSGEYDYLSDNTIATMHSIDLTHSTHAYLQFFAKWALESNYDFVMVMASPAGAAGWLPLCGRYTKPGGMYQGYVSAMYDGQQLGWVQEQINLNDYLGQKIDIQFELKTDNKINYAGFYFDDFELRTVEDSASAVDHTFIANVEDSRSLVSVYPNPAADQISIAITGNLIGRSFTGLLFDCTGRQVMSVQLDKSITNLDVAALAQGIYYLKVANGSNSYAVKKVSILR